MAVSYGLLVPAAASLVTGVLFLLVARRLLRAEYSPDMRSAGLMFAMWWIAIGTTLLTDTGRLLLGLSGDPAVPVYLTLVRLKILLTSIALVALASYVAFLHKGDTRWDFPIILLGIAHALYFLWALEGRLPAHVEVHTWSTRMVLQPSQNVPDAMQALVFYAPGLALTGLYGSLWKRLHAPEQRRRFYAVLAGLVLLFVVSAIQYNPDTPADSAGFLVFPALTIALGVIVLRGVQRPEERMTALVATDGDEEE